MREFNDFKRYGANFVKHFVDVSFPQKVIFMRIRYKLNSGVSDRTGSDSRDAELKMFEDTLGFKEGFSYR